MAEFSASQITAAPQSTGQVFSASDIAKPDDRTPLQRGVHAFWEFTGKPIWDMMQGASRDPEKAKQAEETFKNLVHGVVNEPHRVLEELGNAGNAFMRGDIAQGVRHTAGAVPLVGGNALQVAKDIDEGKVSEAIGHSVGMIAPFAAGPVAEAAGPPLETAGNVLKAGVKASAPDVTSGALKAGAGLAASEIIPASAGPLRYVAGAAPVYAGARQIARGLEKGIEAGKGVLREKAGPPEAPAPEAPAPVVPETPGQAYARSEGYDWSKLSKDEQFNFEAAAKFKANAAEQPAPRPAPPVAPQSAPAPVTQPPTAPEPSAPPASLADQVQQYLASRRPALTVTQAPQSSVPVPAPAEPPPTPTVQAPPQNPRSLAQTEAAMMQKAPAIPEAPRSPYNAAGELKSPQLRAAEITHANTAAKAQRFAEALHQEGITFEDLGNMKLGDMDILTEGMKAKGTLGPNETVPKTSFPMIRDALKKLDAAARAKALHDLMEQSGTLPK